NLTKYVIKLPALEPRLQKRYRRLVQQHLHTAHSVASGLRALPRRASALAATQAAWRFYANPRITLPALAAPLLDHAGEVSASRLHHYALIAHDFSGLNFAHHDSKGDRLTLYRPNDLGYMRQSALLLTDGDGEPIAPLYLGLEAADGVHSTRRQTLLPRRPAL